MKHLFWVIPLTLLLTAFWAQLFRWIDYTFGSLVAFCAWPLMVGISTFVLKRMVQEGQRR